MYKYRPVDQEIVDDRVAEFRDQVRRRLSGELTEDEFRPLRLMNGLYLQRHAYMLRVAIPYGTLSSAQVRTLALIARDYDEDYGHITTRQNIQYNWPRLEDVPDILGHLAAVEMHAIQTSGNCVRNVTSDHLAGIAGDELEDPRPYCELLRQYSTFHPEFAALPRKFKIAMTGASSDRAAVAVHDIGMKLVRNPDTSGVGIQVIVGGGLGRTPVIGKVINECLDPKHILSYTEAILRVYNLHGNRQDKYKARIKILVRRLGIDEFRRQVDEEWQRIKERGEHVVPEGLIERMKGYFEPPKYNLLAASTSPHLNRIDADQEFARWYERNTLRHKAPGYHVVWVALKGGDRPPGDVTADELDLIADLAERYSFGEIRTTHDQNMLLPHIESADLEAVYGELAEAGLARPLIGTLADMITCPGLDFCSLANAGSIGIAKAIHDRFEDVDYLYDLGDLKLKMSGCINACGHHHVGHIGILGIDKRGEEFYQIMLGGSAEDDASLGRWIGKALAGPDVTDALGHIFEVFLEEREADESFLQTYRRIGVKPFSARVYSNHKVKPLRAVL